MTLNSSFLNKMENDFPFKLSPEQKNILLLWFGSDSKFGWSKLDFLVGIHRVRCLYPNHRAKFLNGSHSLKYDPYVDFVYDCDGYGNPVIRLFDSDAFDDDDDFDDDDFDDNDELDDDDDDDDDDDFFIRNQQYNLDDIPF